MTTPMNRIYRRNLLGEKNYENKFNGWEQDFQAETLGLMNSTFRGRLDVGAVPTFFAQNPKLRSVLRQGHGNMLKSTEITRALSTRVRSILDGGSGETAREALEKELNGEVEDLTDEQAEARLRMLMDQKLEQDLKDAVDRADAADMFAGRGLDPEDPEGAVKIMTMLRNRAALDIMKYVGRFGSFVSKKTQAIKEEKGHEIKDVILGSDLDCLLDDHYAELIHPRLRVLFMEQYAEDRLLQFSFENLSEDESNGDCVLMLDISGSMDNLHPVTAGFAMAIFAHFQDEKRRCVLHTYNTQIVATLDTETHTLVDVLQVLMRGTAGGTTLSSAINEAQATWWDEAKDEADLIVITDGDDVYADIRVDLGQMKRTALVIGQTPSSVSAWFDTVMKVESNPGALDSSLCKLTEHIL